MKQTNKTSASWSLARQFIIISSSSITSSTASSKHLWDRPTSTCMLNGWHSQHIIIAEGKIMTRPTGLVIFGLDSPGSFSTQRRATGWVYFCSPLLWLLGRQAVTGFVLFCLFVCLHEGVFDMALLIRCGADTEIVTCCFKLFMYWYRPDMTFAVDWALNNNYLSIYLCIDNVWAALIWPLRLTGR